MNYSVEILRRYIQSTSAYSRDSENQPCGIKEKVIPKNIQDTKAFSEEHFLQESQKCEDKNTTRVPVADIQHYSLQSNQKKKKKKHRPAFPIILHWHAYVLA